MVGFLIMAKGTQVNSERLCALSSLSVMPVFEGFFSERQAAMDFCFTTKQVHKRGVNLK